MITEDSGEEKESVEPTEAAAAQETDFDSAVEISVGQTLSAEVTEESPYAFFKFTAQENGVLSVYSTSQSSTLPQLEHVGLKRIEPILSLIIQKTPCSTSLPLPRI